MSTTSTALHGRTALVTGAGQGLGRAHALALASQGAAVIVNDVVQANADAVVDEIVAGGGRAQVDTHSVTDPAGVEAMVADAAATFGPVDILVGNAGIVRWGPFSDTDLNDFRAVLDVSLWGTVLPLRAAWPGMIERGWGRVIVTTSQAGLWGQLDSAAYCAAKAAVVGLARGLATEVPDGTDVRINAIAPAAATPMAMTSSMMTPEYVELLRPEKVSRLVTWLASEDCHDSGMIFNVGGGRASRVRVLESVSADLPDVIDSLPAEFDDLAGPAEPSDSSTASPVR